MSGLKHLTLAELLKEKRYCEKYIHNLSCKLSGQKEVLKWINNYIQAAEKRDKVKDSVKTNFDYVI